MPRRRSSRSPTSAWWATCSRSCPSWSARFDATRPHPIRRHPRTRARPRPEHRIAVKLVIHAGFPNTGAWAFQAACAEARSALAGVGVCYPDLVETGSGRGHADLAAALARDDFDAVDRLLGAISMQGIVRQCRVVLLSAEEFSGPD